MQTSSQTLAAMIVDVLFLSGTDIMQQEHQENQEAMHFHLFIFLV